MLRAREGSATAKVPAENCERSASPQQTARSCLGNVRRHLMWAVIATAIIGPCSILALRSWSSSVVGGGGSIESLNGIGEDDGTPIDHEVDAAETAAAVTAILASRDEMLMRPPLADLIIPESGHCSGSLPDMPLGGCSDADTEAALESLFGESNGFWASDAKETAAVGEVGIAAGGPAAGCAEATYGEITAEGLRVILSALSARFTKLSSAQLTMGEARPPQPPFDVFMDLGAGTGRTAVAATLLGFAARALGVELGPERFALGCQALKGTKSGGAVVSSRPRRVACNGTISRSSMLIDPTLELIRGDAREWPGLAKQQGWPLCGKRWAVFIAAKCFRASLLRSISLATARACQSGMLLAVLGNRLPETTEKDGTYRWQEIGSVLARTTWSDGTEVFLYQLQA